MKSKKMMAMEEANAKVLTELVVHPGTPETTRLQIYEKLMSGKEGQSYFKTMLEEMLSFGKCPDCGHKNHWLIPEDDLNEMGYVSYKRARG